MPLQNRVTPTGDIIATPHRGMFTGNRGIIHDPATKTLTRRWANRAWLTCVCEFRGRRREVMGGRSWTELFFLDEATAFAAGHRPCFYCRRDDANRFRAAWEARQWRLTAFRRARSTPCCTASGWMAGRKRLHPLPMPLEQLPDGAMVTRGNESYLILEGRALLWSPAGYREAENALQDAHVADAALDAARAVGGISAGAASKRTVSSLVGEGRQPQYSGARVSANLRCAIAHRGICELRVRSLARAPRNDVLAYRSGRPFSSTLIRDSRSVQSRMICRQRARAASCWVPAVPAWAGCAARSTMAWQVTNSARPSARAGNADRGERSHDPGSQFRR